MKTATLNHGGDRTSVSINPDPSFPIHMWSGWRFGRFTPDQARRLAEMLTKAAEAVEGRNHK